MRHLAALLDLPAPDQFTRIRLIIRDEQQLLWTSGTTGNRSLSEHELDDLVARGLALRWEGEHPPLALLGDQGRELSNPAGVWVGREVAKHGSVLPSPLQLALPTRATKVDEHPWHGWFWLEEPAEVQKLRQTWVEQLGRHALQADPQERASLGRLMMSTLPGHELTRAVRIVDLDEGEAKNWLKRQLAAAGLRPDDHELTEHVARLKQLSQPKLNLSVRKERRGVAQRRKPSGHFALFSLPSEAAA